MQMLAIYVGLVSLAVAIPFAGGLSEPTGVAGARDFVQRSEQLQTFAEGAWHRAREVGPGTIDRASVDLPVGFQDDPRWSLQAWSDGSDVYVWSVARDWQVDRLYPVDPLLRGKTSAVLPDGQTAGSIAGVSVGGVIAWRDGSYSSRPGPVPDGCLVIRIRIA